MSPERNHTVFYMETVVLAIVFFLVIQSLAVTFTGSRQESEKAETLTSAVILAEKSAEAFAGTETEEELLAVLNENGNAYTEDHAVICTYDRDMRPAAGGDLQVRITWQEENRFCTGEITVYASEKEIYRLETGRITGGGQ